MGWLCQAWPALPGATTRVGSNEMEAPVFPPCYFCNSTTDGFAYQLSGNGGTCKYVPVCAQCEQRHKETWTGRMTGKAFIDDRMDHHPSPRSPALGRVIR